jgi:hypothetical protein
MAAILLSHVPGLVCCLAARTCAVPDVNHLHPAWVRCAYLTVAATGVSFRLLYSLSPVRRSVS